MKKILAGALASFMIFTTVGPQVAYAKESVKAQEEAKNEETSSEIIPEDGLEISEESLENLENLTNEEELELNEEALDENQKEENLEETTQNPEETTKDFEEEVTEDNTQETEKETPEENIQEDPKLEIADAKEFKRQLSGMRDDVSKLETTKDIQEEMKAEYNDTSLEIEENIDKMSVGAGNFATIYDLDSIPDRVMLLGRLGVAIRFATTELRYKVDAAHTEIAEYVFRGLVIASSPFHSREEIKVYMEEFEALKQKLLGYPDLSLEDTANLYVRSDLDVKLHKARFMKFNDLKNKSTDVIKELDRVIADVTNIRLRPQTTVREIYEASDRLDQAVAKAINSKEYRAPNYIIREIKDWRRKARRAVKDGDKRREVAKLIDETNDELIKTRPSQPRLEGMIEEYQNLFDF